MSGLVARLAELIGNQLKEEGDCISKYFQKYKSSSAEKMCRKSEEKSNKGGQRNAKNY